MNKREAVRITCCAVILTASTALLFASRHGRATDAVLVFAMIVGAVGAMR